MDTVAYRQRQTLDAQRWTENIDGRAVAQSAWG